MKTVNKVALIGVLLMSVALVSACGGGGSSHDDTGTGATLNGTVDTFTASLAVEKKSFFAQIKDFFLPKAIAQAAGVTVTIGSESTTTDANGSFSLTDIPEGASTVTFTQGSNTATYALIGVAAGETFTLDDIDIAGGTVMTANTGTWTGVISMGDGDGPDVDYNMTLVIAAGGNAMSGTMTVAIGTGEGGAFSGVETGTTIDGSYEVTGNNCTLSGPLTGTFSGNDLHGNAPVTYDSCGLEPGDEDPEGHAFHLTKTVM